MSAAIALLMMAAPGAAPWPVVDPVITHAIPGGDAARVLGSLSSESGVPLAMRARDLRGVTLPAIPAGLSVSQALLRVCPAVRLTCHLLPAGIVVVAMPPTAPLAPRTRAR